MRSKYSCLEYLISKAIAELPLDVFFAAAFTTMLKGMTGLRIPLAQVRIYTLYILSSYSPTTTSQTAHVIYVCHKHFTVDGNLFTHDGSRRSIGLCHWQLYSYCRICNVIGGTRYCNFYGCWNHKSIWSRHNSYTTVVSQIPEMGISDSLGDRGPVSCGISRNEV